MGSGVIFVDSPFCPDGLQRCVEFLLLEERLVLVAPPNEVPVDKHRAKLDSLRTS